MTTKTKVSLNAGRTAVPYGQKLRSVFAMAVGEREAGAAQTDARSCERQRVRQSHIDYRKSFGYGSGYGSEYNSLNIKKKQILKAPMERWGMLELIHKSGIRLSRVEKENLLIFGDIRGWEWADYERQKLNYEFKEER